MWHNLSASLVACLGVHLTGESDVNSVTLSESLKEFEMYGGLPDRVCNIRFSSRQGVNSVTLSNISVTGCN